MRMDQGPLVCCQEQMLTSQTLPVKGQVGAPVIHWKDKGVTILTTKYFLLATMEIEIEEANV